MRVHVSVCSLLVCATLGLLAEADPVRTKLSESVEENLILDDNDNLENQRAAEVIRISREIELVSKRLSVENDYGELVEINIEESVDGDESAEETNRNIHDRVFFRLYTRKNPSAYQPLWVGDKEALARSHFNPEKPTHFITHGWVNSGKSPACTLIRNAYLQNDDFNVIVVDWSKITMRPYIWASNRVVMVGKHVAKMIDFLEKHAGLDTGKTALVGHSLGAHVMGLSGYYAKGTINYVVGLDPALPMFALAGVGSRISVKDAEHVQIIHTNAGILGYLEAIGHSDFYPNGGTRQLGCLLDVGGACSHARSYKFFAESINTPKGFYGKPCKSFLQYITGRCKTARKVIMGGSFINFSLSGKYFLSTRALSPFAKGV